MRTSQVSLEFSWRNEIEPVVFGLQIWTEAETQKLIKGVGKFGAGNWSKIRAYYSFNDRTNVNLKDRWRTLKKTNMV